MSIAPELFRKAWGKFPTGVSIVITHTEDGAAWCTTANAVSSVSLEPPLVQLSLGKDGVTCANILRDLRFGINVLREGQDEMAALFARGASVERKEYELIITPATGDAQVIFEVAAATDTQIRHLETSAKALEEIFLEAVDHNAPEPPVDPSAPPAVR